jgi:superfamily I DNA/RNA helicase
MPSYNITMSREFWTDMAQLPPPVYPRAIRTALRMLENPWAAELHPETVRQAENGIHSSRVDKAYRVIWKHIKPNDIVLCLVDKHAEAYRRAARKAFTLEDGMVKVADLLKVGAKTAEQEGSLFGWFRKGQDGFGTLFVGYRDEELLELGVPEDVLPNVRALENVNQIEMVERLLPVEVYDRLLEIALGVVERPIVPDAELQQSLQRYQGGDDLYRFVGTEEFKRTLDGTMEEWMLFLAPHQKQLITRPFNGPARIKGVVGSGKTVVAVHRARHLARTALPRDKKVLFLTYGNRLPGVIEYLLRHLAGQDAPELEAVECMTIHSWCFRFLTAHGQYPKVDNSRRAYRVALDEALADAILRHPGLRVLSRPQSFFANEIRYAIKGRTIDELDGYLRLQRSGRGTPLQESERRAVWSVYKGYQKRLKEQGLWEYDDFIIEALRLVESGEAPDQYMAAVVDEIQDLTEAVMRLLRRIVPEGPDDLFLVGDGLQRIYPGGYALGRLGIDIVGRGTLLRKNYRNTQEILRAAYVMMRDQRLDDMDDGEGKVPEPEFSVRRGELPVLCRFASPEAEMKWVCEKIQELKTAHDYRDRDFAVLYRYRWPYQDLIGQCIGPAMECVELDKDASTFFGPGVKHTTFHSAKGLEFKVVFVVGVTDGSWVPKDDWTLQGEELEDYMARERRLLYVAMTRPRDLLFLTCSRGRASRFLKDVPGEYLKRE